MIKRNIFVPCILILLFMFLYSQSFAQSGVWTTGGELSRNQQQFEVHHYAIHLEVDADNKFISGFTNVHIHALVDDVESIELDFVSDYRIESVQTGGMELEFSHNDDILQVYLPYCLMTDEKAVLKISYKGIPPVAVRPPWSGGFNWSKDPDGNHWVGVSSQLEGSKMWFPSKDHPSSRADSVALHITVPEPYVVAANGILQGVTSVEPDKQTYHWLTRYPIHNYNISINIAKFSIVEHIYMTNTGKPMPVVFYVLPQYEHKADELLRMTIQKLKQLRIYYGEYGFTEEKFGLVHTDYLGMEHQTINSYGNDFKYNTLNGMSYDWLLLHEMGHEWWGNLITVRDWADFWIHEGVTTYTDALFLWDFYNEDAYHAKIREYAKLIKNEKPIIPGRNLTTKEVYNLDVYYKGAYFMHTLSHILGRGTFLNIIKGFVKENRYGYTSTEDFMEFFERYSGYSLRNVFDLYLYSTKLPEIIITREDNSVYAISISNIDFSLPMDVQTSAGIQRLNLSSEPVFVETKTLPIVDPMDWYLKNVRTN